ncbi:glycolate oxidase iron-sulfur subunit [Caldalkalibacillus uzonensis]|uniref:Glycolate oxidase iron-sulfur subunit n=1 Tax=Caldalkalibacillus uzonensis TaxID=353224 RepID=A0ABU0CUE9_9BACI|nr:(Fe-S)-binding protein [Caldalkalibacillus uzonensis]MDQ0340043.1 glycolate oxidase iron-sulfur subunit [Caldalkalibacillus uzonensis]
MKTKEIQGKMPQVEKTPVTRRLQDKLNYDELSNCMRCGFCLPACPTYRETGREASSPRGRIALMKAAVDGHLQNGKQLEDQLNQCLGCRACEPACPAGVKYGELLEQARDALEDHARHKVWVRVLRRFFFHFLFPHPKRLRWLGRLLIIYQKTGLQWLLRKLGFLKLLPSYLREMEAVMPAAASKGVAEQLGNFIPAQGKKKGTVGLFRGCVMDVLFTETNINTVTLLSEAGFDVVIPPQQTCCGALHAHSGEREMARSLARQNIQAFKQREVDYIVSNAGGCGALLQEYEHLLEDECEAKEARWFSERVKDISELLLDHGPVEKWGTLEARITYQASCHLQNVMQVKEQPRQLLRQIKGATYVELFEADRCCGSAGIYNLTQPEMSARILDEKMKHVRATKADILVTSNPGCLLQMKAGIQRAGLSDHMKAIHVVDLLAEVRQKGESRY